MQAAGFGVRKLCLRFSRKAAAELPHSKARFGEPRFLRGLRAGTLGYSVDSFACSLVFCGIIVITGIGQRAHFPWHVLVCLSGRFERLTTIKPGFAGGYLLCLAAAACSRL